MQTRRKLLLKFTSIAAAAAICSCVLYPYGGTLGAPPLNAFSVDSETDVVFDEETGMLYFYGDFQKSDVQAYSGNDAVKGVIAGEYAMLPADSSGLFQGFRSAKRIVLDYADFSKVSDMSSMFSECESLEKLDLGTFETGAVTDMSSMFSGCKALKELNIKTFDTAKVTNMSGMFLACSSLESLDLSNFDTSAVTDMSKMFSGCNALKELNIKSFDTAQVTNMSTMFYGCSGLKSMDLSSFDTALVTNMSTMFYGCSGLNGIDLSSFDTAAVTDMSGMFACCYWLTDLDLSGFDTSRVQKMLMMFYRDSSLSSITVSRKWDISSLVPEDGLGPDCAFDGCTSLVGGAGTVYDSSMIDSGYAHIDGGAEYPGYLTAAAEPCVRFDAATGTLYLSGNVVVDEVQTYAKNEAVKHVVAEEGTVFQEYSGDVFLNFYYVQTIDLSKADTTEVYTMDSMFRNCRALTELDLSSFNTSGVLTMFNMFKDCANLSRIIVSDLWDNSLALGNSESMFEGCTVLVGGSGTVYDAEHTDAAYAHIDGGAENPGYLTAVPPCVRFDEATGTLYLSGNVVVSEVQTYAENEAVKHVVAEEGTVFPESCYEMFKNFKSTETMDLSKADTSQVEVMFGLFSGCNNLTAVDLSNFDTSKVTNMGSMFLICKKLTALDLSNFDTSKVTNMGSMFSACYALAELNLSSFDTSNVTRMTNMFNDCDSLTKLDVSGFDTSNVQYMNSMFEQANNLKRIIVSDAWSTASVTESEQMFAGCTSLVGEKGTVYDEAHTDADYAHIDGGAENPGYLTSAEAASSCVRFDDATGTLYLSGDVVVSEVQAYANNEAVLHVVAEEGTVFPETCYEMFKYFRNVETIDLSGADTSNVKSMVDMFYGCEVLTALDLSSFDTSNVTDMGEMFFGCKKLTELDLSSFDTSNVQYMDHMFENCDEMSWIIIRSFKTSNVVTMANMFNNCHALKTLYLTGFNTSRVEYMDNMFGNCEALIGVDVSGFDTSRVVSMPGMFSACSSLRGLDLRHFDTSNVTDMTEMFAACTELKSLDLRGFNTSQAEKMTGMFRDCSALETITVSDVWNIASETDSDKMFLGCTALVGEQGTVYDAEHTNAAYAHIDGGEENPGYLTAYTPVLFDEATGTLYLSGNVDADEVKAYAYNEAVLHVVANEGTVFPENCEYLFAGFSFAETMDLANADTGNVWDMSSMFSGCKKLTELDLSSFDTSGADFMNDMFRDCSALKTLDLSSFNTSNVVSMYGMFYGCSSLTALDLSSFDTSKVVNMDVMFRECSALPSVDVTGFVTSSLRSMPGMFYDCTAMTVLDLSSFDTSKVKDMIKLFFNCSSLETIIVSDAWNTDSVNFCDNMFDGCTSLSGSKGTVYDAEHIDVSYAHIDGGAENPGYLTAKTDKYSISFDANGGAGSMESVEITAGEAFTLPECGFTAPTYHKFTGWIVGGEQKQPGDTVTLHADTVLTASWDYALITVTFDANGGEGSFVDMTLLSGAMFVFPVCEFIAPEGKTFAGWQYGEMTAQPGDHTVFETDMTIKAIWTDLSDTILVGDVNGDGTVDGGDEMLLSRYVGAWAGIELALSAADLDRDGKVDIRDAMILSRYVAGWEGYDQYIIEIQK